MCSGLTSGTAYRYRDFTFANGNALDAAFAKGLCTSYPNFRDKFNVHVG